jgi:hypothetical protein
MNNITPYMQAQIKQKVPNKPHIQFAVGYWRVSKVPIHPRNYEISAWALIRWNQANTFACRLNENRAYGMVFPNIK